MPLDDWNLEASTFYNSYRLESDFWLSASLETNSSKTLNMDADPLNLWKHLFPTTIINQQKYWSLETSSPNELKYHSFYSPLHSLRTIEGHVPAYIIAFPGDFLTAMWHFELRHLLTKVNKTFKLVNTPWALNFLIFFTLGLLPFIIYYNCWGLVCHIVTFNIKINYSL